MNKIMLLMLCLLMPFAYAQDDSVLTGLNQSAASYIGVDLSNLTPKEQAEVIALASQKMVDKDTPTESIINLEYDKYSSKLKEYVTFGSAIGVKLIEVVTSAGVSADQYIDETLVGKLALFSVFMYFAGSVILKIALFGVICAVAIYSFKKIVFYAATTSVYLDESHYNTITVKKPWYNFKAKGNTVQKKVLAFDIFGESQLSDSGGRIPTFIAGLILVSAFCLILKSFLL